MNCQMRGITGEGMKAEVARLLKLVDLEHIADKLVHEFSGGMRRRLSVALALVGSPKIVFLDEPTTGMDPISRRDVWRMMESLKGGETTLVLTTHSMEEAEVLSDKIVIMSRGRVSTVGTALSLKSRFSAGYAVTLTFDSLAAGVSAAAVTAWVQERLGGGAALEKATTESMQFLVEKTPTVLDGIVAFVRLVTGGGAAGMVAGADVLVAQVSLNDVFLKVAEENERQHDEEMASKAKSATGEAARKAKGIVSFGFKVAKIATIVMMPLLLLLAVAILGIFLRLDSDGGSRRAARMSVLSALEVSVPSTPVGLVARVARAAAAHPRAHEMGRLFAQ